MFQWCRIDAGFNFLACCCRWLVSLWNERVAPVVSAGFLKAAHNSNANDEDEARKLARTALYVLMQRTIVPQCPLVGYGQLMIKVSCKPYPVIVLFGVCLFL